MLTSDQASQLEGRPAPHAHTWGRRGSTCTQKQGLDDLGDRPAPRSGPQAVRAYINGSGRPGIRASSAPDPLEPFTKYLAPRFVDDPHVWASALYDEVRRLGPPLSYPSFVRQVGVAGLRPHCEACSGVKGRDTIEIEHPPGRGDPVGLVRAPQRAVGCDGLRAARHAAAMGQSPRRAGRRWTSPTWIEAMDEVLRRLGGTPRVWRTDRLATVSVPGTREGPGLLRPGGQALSGRRRGLSTPAGQPQRCSGILRALHLGPLVADHDGGHTRRGSALPRRFGATTGDARERRGPTGERTTVAELADAEPLLALPAARLPGHHRGLPDRCRQRQRGLLRQPLLGATGLAGTTLLVRHRLSSPTIDVVAPSGAVLVTHRLAPAGSGALVRSVEQQRGARRSGPSFGPIGREPVVDLSVYGEIAEG